MAEAAIRVGGGASVTRGERTKSLLDMAQQYNRIARNAQGLSFNRGTSERSRQNRRVQNARATIERYSRNIWASNNNQMVSATTQIPRSVYMGTTRTRTRR